MNDRFRYTLLFFIFTIVSACGGGSSSHFTGLTLSSPLDTVFIGNSVKLNAVLTDDFGFDRNANTRVTWSSSDEDMATVEQGTLTAHWEGEVTITARFEQYEASTQLTLIPKLTHIETRADLTDNIRTGDQIHLQIIAFYNNDTEVDVTAEGAWYIDNTNIFDITDTDTLSAGELGNTFIQGQYQGLYHNLELSVAIGIEEFRVTGVDNQQQIGKSFTPHAEVVFTNELIEDITDKITWRFSEQAFEFNDGTFTPLKVGQTVIAAQYGLDSINRDIEILEPMRLFVKSDIGNSIELQWRESVPPATHLYWNTTGNVDKSSNVIEITDSLSFSHHDVSRKNTYFYRLANVSNETTLFGKEISVKPRIGKWHNNNEIDYTLTDQTIVKIDNKVYLIGGKERVSNSTRFSENLYIQDLLGQEPIIPHYFGGKQLTNTAACSSDGSIHIIGGVNRKDGNNNSNPEHIQFFTDELDKVSLAELPVSLQDHHCTYFNQHIYVYGGKTVSGNGDIVAYNDKLFIYNTSDQSPTGTWVERTTNLPPRSDFSSIISNNTIWVFGGEFEGSYLNDIQSINLETDISEQSGATWTTSSTNLPMGLSQHASSLWNGSAYISGGETNIEGSATTSSWLYRFNLSNGELETLGNLRLPRSQHNSIIHDDTLYLLGGVNLENNFNIANDEQYDLVLNQFLMKPTPATSLGNFGLAATDEYIHIFGGRDVSKSDQISRFDNKTGQWEVGLAQLDTALSRMITIKFKSDIFLFGGFGSAEVGNYDAYKYSTSSFELTKLKKPPTDSNHTTMALHQDKIYRFGGAKLGKETLVYDIQSDTWTHLADMPTSRYNATAVTLGDFIYVIGGESSGKTIKTVERYNIPLKQWETVTELPTAKHSATGAVINEKIYIFGGRNTRYLKTSEYYDPYTQQWNRGPNLPSIHGTPQNTVIGGLLHLTPHPVNNIYSGFFNIFR